MGKNARTNGDFGTPIIDDTSAHTGLNYNGFKATEDTVVSVMTGVDAQGGAVNFLTLYNWDGTIKTTHGSLMVERGFKINAITLTSGEIVCL